jgi:hypothetical protein
MSLQFECTVMCEFGLLMGNEMQFLISLQGSVTG